MAGTLEALLHFDGTNGSTSIVDATGKHTWTPFGGTALFTANSKFGPSSISYSNIAGDGTINWGTRDWTVDCWIYFDPSNIGVRADIFYPNSATTLYYDGTHLVFYNGGVVITGTTAVTASAWHHVALTKSGSTHYLFLDGQLQGTWVNAANYGVAPANFPNIQSASFYFQPGSYQDELRIVLDSAEWTANFTPPTSAYTLGSTYTLPAVVGAFTTTGIAAGTLAARTLPQTTVGTFTFTGIAAGSLQKYVLQETTVGNFAFSGTVTGLSRTYVWPAATGAFTTTGINANLVYVALNFYTMPAATGSFTFTGIAASLVYQTIGGYTLAAAPGAFTTTGIAANALYGVTLQQTTVGNFTITGFPAGSISSYVLAAIPGAFVFTATAAGTLTGYALQQTTVGAHVFTGIDVNLIYTPSANAYVMSAAPTTFVFTGLDANLVYAPINHYVLVCGTGQFYFFGYPVGMPGQGLGISGGLGTPVVTIPFGGAPIIDVSYLGPKAGTPVSEAAPGEGIMVTKVLVGGTPVVYI